MLSCKIPTKKMARKNLMHSLPGNTGATDMMGYNMQHGRQEETSVMAARTKRDYVFGGRTSTPNVGFAISKHLQHVH